MKLTKCDVISVAVVDKWKELEGEANKFKYKILDRLDYIIKRCFKEFGRTLDWWSLTGWGDANGELDLDGDTIGNIEFSTPSKDDDKGAMVILLNDGSEWELYEFPTRWLYEDFEDELIKGKMSYEEKVAAKKEASKVKREERKRLKAEALKSAKAKLTLEERKLLGLK